MSLVTLRDVAPRSRRSALTVPGSQPRMLAKFAGLPADQVILDLEDAVTVERKAEARGAVVAALLDVAPNMVGSVRVNGVASGRTHADLVSLVAGAGAHLDSVVVPKVSDAGQLAYVDHLLSQLELEHGLPLGRIGIEVQLEDAAGVLDIARIVDVTPRLEVLTYGPGDLAAALGLPTFPIGGQHPDYPGDHWHHVHATLVLHARRAGIQAIAGPYVQVHDLAGLEELAARYRGIGFDGMWVLHPGQLEVANRRFGVDQYALEWAVDLLDAYTHATEVEGRGAVLFGTEMIDEATRRQALALVARGEREGLQPRTVPAQVPIAERADWREHHASDDGLAR